MSYQGGQMPSNSYWAGHAPPNAYGRQDTRQLPPPPPPPAQPQVSQYHPQSQPQPQLQSQATPNRNQQQWNPHTPTQNGYAMTPGYATSSYQPQMPSPQIRTPSAPPQFISPSQLFQQPSSSIQSNTPQAYQYQRSTQPQPGRSYSSSEYSNASRMAPTPPQDPHKEKAVLLISLAEEYFQAAHAIGPATVLSMSSADVGSYEKLIATGLGCLDAALKQVKLAPRMEANIRLRYAGVLLEETENLMEAETCLSKGISLCERNHYYDLKYAMQFMLTQFMAKKNPKAAMKALDGHINESHAYQHYSWVYVFRLLRASLSIESGTPTDIHVAVQNLQSVATLASSQGDYAIHVVASLMETMAYLRTAGPGNMEHVRAAIAAAWMNQNSNCNIPQLRSLTHILDVLCSYEDGNSDIMLTKLKLMQNMMDEALKDPTWGIGSETIAIPIRRTPKSSQIVSGDTRMILGIGDDGGDKLMMSFLSKKDTFATSYLLSGICLLHKNSGDGKGLKYLQAGLDSLEGKEEARLSKTPGLLPDLIAKSRWRGEAVCYFRVMMAFCHANAGCWPEMHRCLNDLKEAAIKHEIPLVGSLGLYLKYLQGVYYQGTHNLNAALGIYEDESFRIAALKGSHISSSSQFERDIGILAMLNRLSIFQESKRFDPKINSVMLEELKPLCINHPNKDIEIAFSVMSAAVETNPPTPLHDTKNHLRFTISSAGKTKNTQFLCITLSVMFKRFFANVVGDQAEKSARSASVQASKNGNPLWRSVADGMLANCLDVQGKHNEAQHVLQNARGFARKALPQ